MNTLVSLLTIVMKDERVIHLKSFCSVDFIIDWQPPLGSAHTGGSHGAPPQYFVPLYAKDDSTIALHTLERQLILYFSSSVFLSNLIKL